MEEGPGIDGLEERPWTYKPPETKKPRYRMTHDKNGNWFVQAPTDSPLICVAAVIDDDIPHDKDRGAHQCTRLRTHPGKHQCQCEYEWDRIIALPTGSGVCPGYIATSTWSHAPGNMAHICSLPRGHMARHMCTCSYEWQSSSKAEFREVCPVMIEDSGVPHNDDGNDDTHMCDLSPRHEVEYHKCECSYEWAPLNPKSTVVGLKRGGMRADKGAGFYADPLPPAI
jgi:hypothetical protein